MSEEDFACDKFVAQKRKADTCRNCFQSLRLHTKKQIKQGSSSSSSNVVSGRKLFSSEKPITKLLGGRQSMKTSSQPQSPQEEEKKVVSSDATERKDVVTSPSTSPLSTVAPVQMGPAASQKGSSATNGHSKEATETQKQWQLPRRFSGPLSVPPKPLTSSKPSSKASLLPAKPPPPTTAAVKTSLLPTKPPPPPTAVLGGRKSLPRAQPPVTVAKPKPTSSKKPEATATISTPLPPFLSKTKSQDLKEIVPALTPPPLHSLSDTQLQAKGNLISNVPPRPPLPAEYREEKNMAEDTKASVKEGERKVQSMMQDVGDKHLDGYVSEGLLDGKEEMKNGRESTEQGDVVKVENERLTAGDGVVCGMATMCSTASDEVSVEDKHKVLVDGIIAGSDVEPESVETDNEHSVKANGIPSSADVDVLQPCLSDKTPPPSLPDVETHPPSLPDVETHPPSLPDVETHPPSLPDVESHPPSLPDVETHPPSLPDVETHPPSLPDVESNPPSLPDVETHPPPLQDVDLEPTTSEIHSSSTIPSPLLSPQPEEIPTPQLSEDILPLISSPKPDEAPPVQIFDAISPPTPPPLLLSPQPDEAPAVQLSDTMSPPPCPISSVIIHLDDTGELPEGISPLPHPLSSLADGELEGSLEYLDPSVPPPILFSGSPVPPPPPIQFSGSPEPPPPPVLFSGSPVPPPPPPPPPFPSFPSAIHRSITPSSGASPKPPQKLQPPLHNSAHANAMAAICSGNVSLRKVPLPTEQPANQQSAHANAMAAICSGISLRKVAHPAVQPAKQQSAHDTAMAAISSGISLRKVVLPVERPFGEDKVVDVASEMKQKLSKFKREERHCVSGKVEEKKEDVRKVVDFLRSSSNTRSYVHQLQTLLTRVDDLLSTVGISEELLQKHLQWPAHLVKALREVLHSMHLLEQAVVNTETVSRSAIAADHKHARADAAVVQVNPEVVDRCISRMLTITKSVRATAGEEAHFFPIFEHELERFLQRASEAIIPLLDLLYQKAFLTYESIFLPSTTKFDRNFRVQNTLRLFKMCHLLSDGLLTYLNMQRHPNYSQGVLMRNELVEKNCDELVASHRNGGPDVKAKPGGQGDPCKNDVSERVLQCLIKEDGSLTKELEAEVTPDVFMKMEKDLVRIVLAKKDNKLVEAAIMLTRQVYSAEACHRCDYDWLYHPLVKGDHERITFLVNNCGLRVDAKSTDTSHNSLLHRAVSRKDLVTAAFLIRLGADPLITNSQLHTPVQQLSIGCFPYTPPITRIEEKEPLFSLTSYINNPSLSDVVLISEDGKRFHGHRLVLCAQSPVFKTMMDSDLWKDSRNKEVPLPSVSGSVLEYLLQYLYSGRCLFPRDDLNLGLDLMAAADQFLLDDMKQQCQLLLSEKIDAEVVVPLYFAAVHHSSSHLLHRSSHYLCAHYEEIEDPEHQALLHLLDNTPPQSL